MDPEWRRKKRPMGWYRSSVSVPGNYFAEGMVIVNIGFITETPFEIHCSHQQAVAFTIYDTIEGDSARGDFGTKMGGVVRPLLSWKTYFSNNGSHDKRNNGIIRDNAHTSGSGVKS
jgi:lipopolysaccharide transport system ATP-binding protein